MVVNEFLKERAEFTLKQERQLLPFADGIDGAYVATMTKAAQAGQVRT
jgi:hypothetical protein